MDVLLVGLAVFLAVMAASAALRPGEDDPNWELRWRGLDPGYRDWLAAMTTDYRWMRTLSDPEEVELARGFERRERRRLAYYELAPAAFLALGAALALAGLLPLSAVGGTAGIVATIPWLIHSWRRRQIRRKVQLGFEPGELPTPLNPPRGWPSPQAAGAPEGR